MSGLIRAPWSEEQVRNLNEFQEANYVHPFTCARRTETLHRVRPGRDMGQLIATPDGWICPDCDYTQDWALDSMADGVFLRQTKDNLRDLLDSRNEAPEGP